MALPTSRLRIAAAILIVLVMGTIAAHLIPIYLDNLQLQRYVEELAQSAGAQTRPDDVLRVRVLQKAAALGLPVRASQVLIKRPNGQVRIEVRYAVRVDLPLYTVDLHFYPGAGSK